MEDRTVKLTSKNFKNQNTFGGYVFASDFCTDHTGTKDIASRIISDWMFDRTCEKNIKNGRKNIKSYK